MASRPRYDDSPKRKRVGAQIVVWALMAMLVVGLGGFGVTNFGGGCRSNRHGGRPRYRRLTTMPGPCNSRADALVAQIWPAHPLCTRRRAFGLDQQVLQASVTQAALDDEAARIGLSVGRCAWWPSEITGNTRVSGRGEGTFDRETYRFTLRRNNLTEAEFEGALRDDLSRALLQGAVSGGFAGEGTLTDTLYTHIAERRGFSLLQLTEADLTAPAACSRSTAELQAHYEANVAAFTRPEAKRITYAALLPEAQAAEMPVDDAALQARLCTARIAEFVQPERRLVERLVLPDRGRGRARPCARLDAGETVRDAGGRTRSDAGRY
ncbi:MAG: SurA N-terminal domain-containing protein [Gemmobacter sp.]|nr:SurA N-terminal domain-containing protein [Gemmobacter sp.]